MFYVFEGNAVFIQVIYDTQYKKCNELRAAKRFHQQISQKRILYEYTSM